MATAPSLPLDSANQIARFRRFLSRAVPFAAFCVLAAGVTFVLLRDPIYLVVGGIISVVVTTWSIALVLLRHGRLRAAVLWVACGLLLGSATMTVFVRGFIAVLVLPPLLVICVAMTFGAIEDDLNVLMVVCGLVGLGNVIIDLFIPAILAPSSSLEANIIINVAVLLGLIIGALWLFRQSLRETFRGLQSANHDLAEAQASLQRQVEERTTSLQTALAEVEARATEQAHLLGENEQQRRVIRELSVPVLPITPTTLVMPLVGTFDSARLRTVQEQALQTIERTAARALVLDITGVPVVDAEVATGLVGVVRAARLLGAEVLLVGIRPEVAQAIVGLALPLGNVRTAATLQDGLAGMLNATNGAGAHDDNNNNVP
jgi:rsbT co-antagonist protein RsbR